MPFHRRKKDRNEEKELKHITITWNLKKQKSSADTYMKYGVRESDDERGEPMRYLSYQLSRRTR